MINICVPVLKRYDRLRDLIQSCLNSDVKPDGYWIVDNGRNRDRLVRSIGDLDIKIHLHTPAENLGVAASWNWFLRKVPDVRVIVNDDIEFAPHSLEKIVAIEADLVLACGFSCFVLRDSCVEKVGYFDEDISPGYGYYEDEDYARRIERLSTVIALSVDADVLHHKSSTLQVASHDELLDHHVKFKRAQANYAKKWALEEAFK